MGVETTNARTTRHDMVDLTCFTLRAGAAGIREGRFTSEELANAYFARIQRYDRKIHAWAWIDHVRALARAGEADLARRKGSTVGPLHGMPIAVKDVIHTAGIPTGMGSAIFDNFVPAHSGACVDNLVVAGAYVQGKTITTEFATRHPGPTTNPWNTQFSPGGSSSGSAAAVAAGFTSAALGTQTVGSIVRPAAYCGIVGYKPSLGLISRFGVHPVSQTLDQVGVLTRTVDDAALLVASIMGSDPRDGATLIDFTPFSEFAALAELPEPPSIAVVRSPSWALADGDQRALLETNCATLARHGARMQQVELPARFAEAVGVIRTIQAAEAAANFRTMMQCDADRTSVEFRALFDRGMGIAAADYLAALDTRLVMRAELDALFCEFDAIATPPATGEPPRTIASTGSADFCAIWTLCGVPSVAIPTGLGPHGLPMGLQIVGKYLDDHSVLQTSLWCAKRLPFPFHPSL